MSLPPSSEKAQLTPLPEKLHEKITEKAVFFVQNQALPTGWSVLQLSLGLSGIVNVFCSATALADPGYQNADRTGSVTTSSPLAALELSARGNLRSPNSQSATNQGAINQSTTIETSHLQSQRWKAERSPSPTKLSFHPAPLLTDMGPLTRALTSDEAIAHNQSQRLAIQAGPQPKFSPKVLTGSSSSSSTSPITQAAHQQATNSEATSPAQPTQAPLNAVPLDIAKLSEPVALSALTQLTTHNHVDEKAIAEAITQNDISLESLLAGSLAAENISEASLLSENPVAEKPVNSTEGSPSESDNFPNGNGQDVLELRPDIGPNVLPEALESSGSGNTETANTETANTETANTETINSELGILRVQPTRSRASEELGILRLMQTAQAPPPPPRPPISFLTGRLGFFSSENAFRSNPRIDESIYQSGLAYYLFPKLSDRTSLYAIAETNLARYDQFQSVNYNELEVQLGVRQRLLPRTYAQLGWRNQRLYSPGYREKLFSVNYIDTMISHRSILNSKTWVDGFYQARLGFADPDTASRFRQTFTLSLNYGATRDLRTSLLYQLDFDDYTQVPRYDTYQQLLGIVSYNLTPESRISVFGGTRFGRSSSPGVNLDDTFYGAGLNVSVPLF